MHWRFICRAGSVSFVSISEHCTYPVVCCKSHDQQKKKAENSHFGLDNALWNAKRRSESPVDAAASPSLSIFIMLLTAIEFLGLLFMMFYVYRMSLLGFAVVACI